ncbi:MAG: FHA domain-containing protein, partial [Isosphaeraceae bacterium]|nr:FHA domain-containing protein [Isosphaeraceae bacterium]
MPPGDHYFLSACGLRGALRLGLEGYGDAEIECRLLPQPFAVVGRAPGVDLRLEHPVISRRHAYLQVIAGRLFCVDLRSRTGTHWEEGARPMGWLGRGEAIRIGPYRLRYLDDDAGEGVEPPPPRGELSALASLAFEPAALTEGTLEFLDREPALEPTLWPIHRPVVLLGRSLYCAVQLSGAEVSRFHCSLVRTPQGIWVVDLLGRGGTLVNGEPGRSIRLADGDVLQVGSHRLRLWYGPPAARRSPHLAPLAGPAAAEPELATRPEVGVLLNGRPEVTDALLGPLLSELGRMQQQMADQYQQALLTMFRLFSNMHQEQMALIREELAQIQRLTEQQQALQAELTQAQAP